QIAAELAASKQTVPELAARAARRAPGAGSAAVTAAAANPASAAPVATAGAAARAGGAPTLLNITRQIAAEQHRLTLRDQRITARRRLADIYGRWDAIVAGQERAILHACLISVAIVLAAILLLQFADRWLERLLGQARVDRRQLATLRSVVGVALQ